MSDNKVKLLIVEDDKEIRELLGAFLTDNGYEISYAAKRHAFCKAEPSLLCMACTSLMRCGTERALFEVKMPTYLQIKGILTSYSRAFFSSQAV